MLKSLKQKKLILTLAAAGVTGLALGGVFAYWALTQRRPLAPEVPIGTDLVPQETTLSLSLSTNERQWQQLQEFGTPESREVVKQAVTEWRDRFLTQNGLNYQEDIQPWIGREITVAFLPNRLPPVSGSEDTTSLFDPNNPQSMVVLLPIADPTRLPTNLSALGGQPSGSTYQGLPIYQVSNKAGATNFAAVVDQATIAVSKEQRAIERVIDTYKGAESLASTPGYVQSFKQVAVPNPLVRIYVNGPVAKEAILANSSNPLPLWGLTPLQHNQGLAATVTADATGIQVSGLNWLPANHPMRYRVANEASRVPSLLPDSTLLMLSGGDLNQFWKTYRQQSPAQPDQLANPQFLEQAIRSTTGLDWQTDFLSWMNGEFAIAAIPTPAPDSALTNVGVVLLAQAGDRRAADETLKKLDGIMSSRYGFRVSEADLQGEPVVKWVSQFGAVSATRGWLDGNVAFLAVGEAIATDLLPQPSSTLATNELFRQATATQMESNNGHFFVDTRRLMSEEMSLPLPKFPPDVTTLLQSIQSIGVTAAIQSDRSTRYDLHMIPVKETAPRSAPPVPPTETTPTASPQTTNPSP